MKDSPDTIEPTTTYMSPEDARQDAFHNVSDPHAALVRQFGETAIAAESAAVLAATVWEKLREAKDEIKHVAQEPINGYVRDVDTPHPMAFTAVSHSREGAKMRCELDIDLAAANALIYAHLTEQSGAIPKPELVRADRLIDRAYGLDGNPADARLRTLVEEVAREEMARIRIEEAKQTGIETAQRHVHLHHTVGSIVDSVKQNGFLHGDMATRALHALGGSVERTVGHLPLGHEVVKAAHDVWHAMNDHEQVAAEHVIATTSRFIADLLGSNKYSSGQGDHALFMLQGASTTMQPAELLPPSANFSQLSRALAVRLIQIIPDVVFAQDASLTMRDLATQARLTGEIDYLQGDLSLTAPYWTNYAKGQAL